MIDKYRASLQAISDNEGSCDSIKNCDDCPFYGAVSRQCRVEKLEPSEVERLADVGLDLQADRLPYLWEALNLFYLEIIDKDTGRLHEQPDE